MNKTISLEVCILYSSTFPFVRALFDIKLKLQKMGNWFVFD